MSTLKFIASAEAANYKCLSAVAKQAGNVRWRESMEFASPWHADIQQHEI